MNGKVSVDDRRRLVAASLQVGNPGNNARELPNPAQSNGECQMVLDIAQIHPYEHNPRRAHNVKFDDIKESIRTGGLRSPLTVTRRPGQTHFIVEAGGNTRLLALKQLWAETRDVRFQQLVVLFRPWRSESHVLTAHLIENEQRGDMSFWDRASGMVALKARLEAEAGKTLTLRPLEDALHGLGLAVNTATLGLYLYAIERLGTLGEAVPDLAGLDVKTLQPRLNALRRFAQAQADLDEDAVYRDIFEPGFRSVVARLRHSGGFSVAATVEACEKALADHLGIKIEDLRSSMGASVRKSETEQTRLAPAPWERANAMAAPVVTAQPQAPVLLGSIGRFAELAGISGAWRYEPSAPKGFLVESSAQDDDPVHRRCWSLLAMVAGQEAGLDGQVLGADFFDWLADPQDLLAQAFWEVLDGLRPTKPAAHAMGAELERVC